MLVDSAVKCDGSAFLQTSGEAKRRSNRRFVSSRRTSTSAQRVDRPKVLLSVAQEDYPEGAQSG